MTLFLFCSALPVLVFSSVCHLEFLFLLWFHGELSGFQLLVSHLYFPVETNVISVTQEKMLVVVTVPVLWQDCRDFIFRIAVLERLWMSDIFVVGDTAILCRLLMTGREQCMHLVSVTDIRAKERTVEMWNVLVAEIAPCVLVVQVKAETKALVGIHSKLCIDVILTIGFVTTVVIEDVCKWR